MKLLVLAQTPPPLHGQSTMVQVLVNGLPARGIPLHHVNLKLSADSADIGRWRFRKVMKTFGFAWQAIRARFTEHCDTLYYIPAPPAKRGALYRDWLLLFLCRPFFRACVLHWHASGLGEWLAREGTLVERWLSRWLLGGVDLAIVLSNGLRADAERFRPRRIAIVPNGLPVPSVAPLPPSNRPYRLLFLGLCSEEKGLFSATSAVLEANRRAGANDTNPAFVLVAAGPFPSAEIEQRFHRLVGEHPNVFRHAGVVSEAEKSALFAQSHALVFPTRYPAEAMPLVALEALGHDRPVVATGWRALPDIVTPDVGILVPSANDAALAAALAQLRDHPPLPRACRGRFLAHFTVERHLIYLAAALTVLDESTRD